MTRKQNNASQTNWKALIANQEDFLKPLIREVLQQVLESEMEEALGAEKGERTPNRLGYGSGYYGRTLITRVGKLELWVPQDRQGRFRTEIFERYQRSEKALVAALTEMYVQGVSTRKVKAVTEELCGHEISAATMSRLNQGLDRGQDVARRGSAFQHLEEPQPLAGDLVGHGVLVGQVVPGGEDGRPGAAEAVQVVGPGVEVARVGDDHQQSPRCLQGKSCRGNGSGRAPGAIDGGTVTPAQGG